MPTTGSIPLAIPMFTATCQKTIAVTPTASNVPKRSRACRAIHAPRAITAAYSAISSKAPAR